MALIAGTVNKNRNIQHLDHLLDLRGMEDHCRFNGKVTFLIHHQLVIRLTVFSGKQNIPRPHSLRRIVDIPAGGLGSAQTDRIHGTHGIKQGHGRSRRQINSVEGLLQYNDILIQGTGCFLTFRHDQISGTVMHIDQSIPAFIIIHVEAFRIGQLHGRFISKSLDLRSITRFPDSLRS